MTSNNFKFLLSNLFLITNVYCVPFNFDLSKVRFVSSEEIDCVRKNFEKNIPKLDSTTYDMVRDIGGDLVATVVFDSSFFPTAGLVNMHMQHDPKDLGRAVDVLSKSKHIKPEVFMKFSAKTGNSEFARIVVETYLKSGLRVSDLTWKDESMLCLFCRHDMPGIVDMLLRIGADVNRIDKDGMTSLGYAARVGSTRCIDLLMRYGANPEVEPDPANRPLMLAAISKESSACKMLARHISRLRRDEKSYLQILAQPRWYKTKWDRMYMNIRFRELIGYELKKSCIEEDMCPLCFTPFKELCGQAEEFLPENVELLACCLKPICKACKVDIKARGLGCPRCRNREY